MINKNFLRYVPYSILVLLRLILPFFIWKNVLGTLIAVLFFDLIDFLFFRLATNWPLSRSLSEDAPIPKIYKKIDKILDFYWYSFILLYVYVRASSLFFIFLFFYILRLIGMLVFFLTQYRKTFLFFPNLVGGLFAVYVLTLTYPLLSFLLRHNFLYVVILFLIPIKLVDEYVCNIMDMPNFFLSFLNRKKL